MLSIKIDSPELESRFKEYAVKHKKDVKDLIKDALKVFLELNAKDDELIYVKKDPMKHIHQIEYDDDGEDLSDIKLYSQVEDTASYTHNLRRKRIK